MENKGIRYSVDTDSSGCCVDIYGYCSSLYVQLLSDVSGDCADCNRPGIRRFSKRRICDGFL